MESTTEQLQRIESKYLFPEEEGAKQQEGQHVDHPLFGKWNEAEAGLNGKFTLLF